MDGALDEALLQIDLNWQLNPMVKQAVNALLACPDYEEAAKKLVAPNPDLDNSTLQHYKQNALYMANLLGQSNE